MQTALQQRGWQHISRSQSMAFANMAMGICRPADIARNLGISRQAVSNMLKEMVAEGLVEVRPDPGDRRASIVSYSEKSLTMRTDAMDVLTKLEAIVGERIGRHALETLRDALSKDWGPVPELSA